MHLAPLTRPWPSLAEIHQPLPPSVQLTAAARDLGLDAAQRDTWLGGYVQAAFFVVGVPSALIVGYLADRADRIKLLLMVVVVGHAPCLCTYWVRAGGLGGGERDGWMGLPFVAGDAQYDLVW